MVRKLWSMFIEWLTLVTLLVAITFAVWSLVHCVGKYQAKAFAQTNQTFGTDPKVSIETDLDCEAVKDMADTIQMIGEWEFGDIVPRPGWMEFMVGEIESGAYPYADLYIVYRDLWDDPKGHDAEEVLQSYAFGFAVKLYRLKYGLWEDRDYE